MERSAQDRARPAVGVRKVVGTVAVDEHVPDIKCEGAPDQIHYGTPGLGSMDLFLSIPLGYVMWKGHPEGRLAVEDWLA